MALELYAFVLESNRIEGIRRDPLATEIQAHRAFLSETPSVTTLSRFVSVVQPDAILRDKEGLNVIVGNYRPPSGGADIRATLGRMLRHLHDPYLIHQAYEALHPFTDGNGRSGRVLWLYMMGGPAKVPLGFLHSWYYQSLRHHSGRHQVRITEDFWRA